MNEPKEEKVREKLKLSEFYNSRKISNHVNVVKFLLMPFVFLALLGFSIAGTVGVYISSISNFAALSFFIFCGFFTLVPDRERRVRKLKRGIKRSWLFFLILFVAYFAINVIYLAYANALKFLISPEFLQIRTFFDFLVLNVWPLPMGNSIWFIQALAYSYLFFFLAEKFKLSKIYIPLLVVLLVFMLLSGEFAKLVGFPYFGYRYIPGGWLTKALPFMLIGMLLRRGIDKLARIPRFVYIITFFAGIGCAVGERLLLEKLGQFVYSGNAIGYAIMAISVCLFAVTLPDIGPIFLGSHGGNYARRMYALCQPVYLLLWVVVTAINEEFLSTLAELASVICFAICFALAFLIGLLRFRIAIRNLHGRSRF